MAFAPQVSYRIEAGTRPDIGARKETCRQPRRGSARAHPSLSVAKLAQKEGSRTRAIIKLLGRGAIMLTIGSFNLGIWILGALFTLIAFVASLKGMTERVTLRVVRHRKERRRRKEHQRFAALTAARV